MTTTLKPQTQPKAPLHPVPIAWVCITAEGLFQCQQTETGWQACSVRANTTAVYGEGLPHQAAATVTLWQVILQSGELIVRVNPVSLPDDPTQLKQIIARLGMGTLTLECFSPYHAHSFTVPDVETAFAQLHEYQPLFPGAVNGPKFSYQRLVTSTGTVISEVGDPAVAAQFSQFAETCAQFQPELAYLNNVESLRLSSGG